MTVARRLVEEAGGDLDHLALITVLETRRLVLT